MPINLPSEILWHIFMLNASDQREHGTMTMEPLVNTRNSSQVCHEWRHIIMSSSKMWGRLILFDDSQRKEWIEEVLRRSGSAPLWVYCSVWREEAITDKRRMDASSFFFEILAKNWERVEVMVYMIVIHDEHECQKFARDWAFLHRPAPLLRVFSAWAYDTPSLLVCCPNLPRPVPVKKPLFSATSPLLHTFHSNFDLIDHHELNFTNLRTLHIFHHSDLSQLLRSLKMMPSLESFSLETFDNYDVGNIPDVQSTIVLPRLSKLATDTPISAFLAMLDRIATAPRCCFQSTIRYHDSAVLADSILEQVVRQVPKLLVACIEHAEVTKISGLSLCILGDNVIRLSSCNRCSGPDFSLRFVWSLSREQYERFFPELLYSFQSRHFSDNVSDLYLELALKWPISHPIKNALEALLLSTTSVTRLHVRRISILKAYVGINLFPRLNILYIRASDFESPVIRSTDDTAAYYCLLDFLQGRINIGLPVSMVYIEGPSMMRSDRFTRLCILLNDLDGLKVVCEDTSTGQKIEYFCGSV